MVTSLVLASCNPSTTPLPRTSLSTTSTTITTPNTTTSINPTATTSTTPATTVVATTTATGNWWDSLGKPQYGNDLNLLVGTNVSFFDPYQGETLMSMMWGWTEQLFTTDWTENPTVQPYQMGYWDSSFAKGQLLSSWEFPNPGTFVMHVRQGINWQNISPANGREFVASDIVFHFNRMLGTGNGYTTPAPYWGTVAWTKSVISIAATDKYTVTMVWNTPNPEFILETLGMPGAAQSIENPEAVQQWGNLYDWHHAVGTGPFILTDFVDSSSMTMVKNPNYWGYDERYPQNKLPYVNRINCLIISNNATAMSAMRVGKIDIADAQPLTLAQGMKKSNPEIVQIPVPSANGLSLDPRNDLSPFTDINVRIALQEAINLPEIAQTYFGGTCSPDPLSLTSAYLTGWGYPYSQWPASLKATYAYNPTNAKALLTTAGYPNGFNTNIVVVTSADMGLLQIVQSYFSSVGVNMTITTMDSASFNSFVGTSHANTGLAQRASGTLSLGGINPIRDLSRLQVGQPADVAMVNDPIFNAFYNQALAATTTSQVKTILMNANQYVAQQHFVISLLDPTLFNFCQPWIKGFNGQYGSTAGSNGIFLQFYYEARFWVDEGMK